MPLTIKTTGFEDFLDGSANIKMLIIGGPDVGKTRSASYWPRPFFIDTENSRGSLADRRMPYVEVHDSKDMLDALAYLKDLEAQPKAHRDYQTVVVDTLDSFQRLVKDEWLQDNNANVFKGFDAWGYLDSKMQMLMTRLLNLDYNVIVNCHYREKGGREEGEQRELTVQLQGFISETIYNDFALIGWMGTYWEHDPEKGERVARRGIKFDKTKELDKPFLKDRYNLTQGRWLPIVFSDEDFNQFSRLFAQRAEEAEFPDAEEVGTVPEADATFTRNVVGPMAGGPVAKRAPKEKPLDAHTKPELAELGKTLGLNFKGNALKGEMITAIEKAKAGQADASGGATASPDQPGPPASATESRPCQDANADISERRATDSPSAPEATQAGTMTANPPSPDRVSDTDDGGGPHTHPESDSASASPPDIADETGGAEQSHQAAEALLTQKLGATKVSEGPGEEPTPPPPPPAAVAQTQNATCETCGKDLADENQDYVQLAWFKFRKRLCNTDYSAAREAAKR